MDDLDKKFYKISEVSELLGIPTSTLRFWEKQFTVVRPYRTTGGTRKYTPSDIEKIKMIHYLVKERGLKLDKAQEVIAHNRKGVSKKYEVITRLEGIREQLTKMLEGIGPRQ